MSIVCCVYVCDECAARYVYDEIVGLWDGPGAGRETPPTMGLEFLFPGPVPPDAVSKTDQRFVLLTALRGKGVRHPSSAPVIPLIPLNPDLRLICA